MKARMRFEFTVTYFKPNGKYYTHDKFQYICTNCAREDQPPTCYMQDVVDYFNSIMKDNGPQRLPGLNSSKWDGYICVDCDYGYPLLIIPQAQHSPQREVSRWEDDGGRVTT